MTSQRQQGGDDNTNIQAGNDVSIQITQGASLEEVKAYVLGLFYDNFMQLRGVAEAAAERRVRELTDGLLERLHREDPELLKSFEEPSMQQTMFRAQAEYAISGEDDLAKTLTEILIDRAKEETRSLRALALEEAISVAGKMTPCQREAVALVFGARHVQLHGDRNEIIVRKVARGLLPFTTMSAELRDVDLRHLTYLGVGTISLATVSLGQALASPSFSKPFEVQTLSPEMLAIQEVLTEPVSEADPSLVRLKSWVCNIDRQIPQVQADVAHVRSSIDELVERQKMNPSQVLEFIAHTLPQVRDLDAVWNDHSLGHFELTSVGLVLGHAYWTRHSGETATLSIWV